MFKKVVPEGQERVEVRAEAPQLLRELDTEPAEVAASVRVDVRERDGVARGRYALYQSGTEGTDRGALPTQRTTVNASLAHPKPYLVR